MNTISPRGFSKPSSMSASLLMVSLLFLGCYAPPPDTSDAIHIGALLPFSGEQAAMGMNIEQAMILAVSDVNDAGGIGGRPLDLITRDSNSGSDRGYEQARTLLYEKELKYLIGPEENGLAKQLIADVKTQDVLHILPGVSAPTIKQSGARGAWVRLAPSPSVIGCAMAYMAISEGHDTAATVVFPDDYQTLLATQFNSHFAELGGHLLGTLSVQTNQSSFVPLLNTLAGLDADVTLMLAYPTTAAVITRDCLLSGQKGAWYLAPTLFTDVFLKNVPSEALQEFTVFSPSLSLTSECDASEQITPEAISCERKNINRFSDHYADAWGGDRPLPAALFYYDAVVLLAMSLHLAQYEGNDTPSPAQLRDNIKVVSEQPGETVHWYGLDVGLAAISAGREVAYSGAAAEYTFPVTRIDTNYGIAEHRVVDAWEIAGNDFALAESIWAYCLEIVFE